MKKSFDLLWKENPRQTLAVLEPFFQRENKERSLSAASNKRWASLGTSGSSATKPEGTEALPQNVEVQAGKPSCTTRIGPSHKHVHAHGGDKTSLRGCPRKTPGALRKHAEQGHPHCLTASNTPALAKSCLVPPTAHCTGSGTNPTTRCPGATSRGQVTLKEEEILNRKRSREIRRKEEECSLEETQSWQGKLE